MTFFQKSCLPFFFHLLFANVYALPPNFSPGPIILSPTEISPLANETILRTGNDKPIPQDIYIHVITGENSTNNLSFPIKTDALGLNESSEQYGITFNIRSTNYITNQKWFTAAPNSTEQDSMKRALHRGGYDDLNVYLVNSSAAVQGQGCTPPSRNPTGKQKELDGCILGYQFLQTFNPASIVERVRVVTSFRIINETIEVIAPLAPEIGRWYAMDINVAENCLSVGDNSSSLCVYKEGNRVQKGPVANGHGPLLGPTPSGKCLNETSPILCFDSTKLSSDVEARMERAILYGIGALKGNVTTSS